MEKILVDTTTGIEPSNSNLKTTLLAVIPPIGPYSLDQIMISHRDKIVLRFLSTTIMRLLNLTTLVASNDFYNRPELVDL